MKIDGYAALEAGAKLVPHTFEHAPITEDEVVIEVDYCGICHSDVHLIQNDWGMSQFPLVPGHEVVGTVQTMGSSVKGLKVGDRVGLGWQCGSCLQCEWCISGKENFCSANQATATGMHGGITVYTSLRYYGVHSAMHVGVIGVGGLGHMALQFADHWGS